jgi:hypothetical protein
MFEEARGKKLLIIGAETNIMHIVTQAKEKYCQVMFATLDS